MDYRIIDKKIAYKGVKNSEQCCSDALFSIFSILRSIIDW